MIGKRDKCSGGSKKTVNVGVEVTSGGRLFQRRLSSHWKRTIANSGQPCTSDH